MTALLTPFFQRPPSSFIGRLLRHLIAALALAVLFVLPDHLYGLMQPNYPVRFYARAFAAVWIFAALMLGLRHRLTFLLFLGLIALLQLAQFLHFSYFGTLISPHEVLFLFSEWDEIWLTLSAVLPYMAAPLVLVAAAAAGAYSLRQRAFALTLRLPFAALALLLLLSILPYRAFVSAKSQGFYPSPTAYSIRNTLYAASYFVGRRLRGEGGQAALRPHFLPYVIEKLPLKQAPIIVIVMGESLTYKHMSLFGYERPTTPELESLREDAHFVYHRAIAGGVATKVSLPAFYNVQREPGNVAHLMRYESNLLKLAKERGYKTYYISAQTPNLSTYAGTEFADEFITQADMGEQYETLKDDVLLRQLARIDLARPVFIVLHQRNSHSPYDSSYPAGYGKYPVAGVSHHDYTVNAYDNSVRYTDHLLRAIIDDIQRRSRLPAYLFFTADHGEMMGEGGKYGHTLLEPDVVRVPFVFYATAGADGQAVQRVRAMQAPTHYEIGQEIARLLGYKIGNPNEVSGRYYANGPDLGGMMGCLVVEKNGAAPDGALIRVDRTCRAIHGVAE